MRKDVDGGLIEQLVFAERTLQPRLEGITIGRDRFFGVLQEKGLLLEPLPAAPRTTDSWHSLPVFRNLVKDLELDGPNQAWTADITYIRTDEGFLYLSLLTDLGSRKIVGCHAGDTLEAEGSLRRRTWRCRNSRKERSSSTIRIVAASIVRTAMLKSSRPMGLP
jgi:hypothetical protein